MEQQHPFAQYIRTLGRGKRGSRDLTADEAFDAFSQVMTGAVEPVQLGAFLMLIRVKEETPEELAAFVRAARAHIAPVSPNAVDLDWSSYAGKRRQLPWFILSALLLVENGIRVLMHGLTGRKDDRIYTPAVLRLLKLPVCASVTDAERAVKTGGFAFIDLKDFLPRLAELIELRELLGLRSPVHSLSRLLNPLNAPAVLQGVFHPPYKGIHQKAGQLLGVPQLGVLKGEGGEIERNPDQECEVLTVHNGEPATENWPAMFARRHLKDETMDPARLAAVWRGEAQDEYGEAAAIGTAAIALKLIGKAATIAEAQTLAEEMWAKRPRSRL